MAIGNPITLTSNVASKTISVIATAGQTLFTVTGGYRINQLAVFRNGVRLLDSRDYEARNGATVTLLSAATVGDALEFQVFDDFRVADAIVSAESEQTISGNLIVSGILTATDLRGSDVTFRHVKATGISTVSDTTQSTTTTTGAMIVSGGLGVAKNLFVGGSMNVAGTLTYEDVTNSETAGITTTGGLVVTGLGATFGSGVGIADSIYHIDDSNTAIRFPANDTFTVTTAGSERVRITSAGLVGIGSESPAQALDILNTNPVIRLTDTDPAGVFSQIDGAGGDLILAADGGAGSSNSFISLRVDGTDANAEKVRITSAGDLQARRSRSNTAGDVALSIQPSDSSIHYGFRIDSANNNLNLDRVGTGNFITVSNSGFVAIGTENPSAKLHVSDGANGLEFNPNSQNAVVSYNRVTSAYAPVGLQGSTIALRIGGVGTALQVDSSGRVLVGLSAARETGSGFEAYSQIEGGDSISSGSLTITSNRSIDDLGARLNFARSKGGSVGSNTVVDDNAELGGLYFWGADGTDTNTQGAEIIAEVDGTPGSNDMPCRLVFSTTADGAASPTERLRIDSDGRFATNGRAPSDYNNPAFLISGDNATLTIMGDGSTNNSSIAAIKFRIAGTSTGDYTKAAIFAKRMGGYNDLDMIFALDTAADANGVNLGNEKMRLTSAGNLLIGTDDETGNTDRLLQVGDVSRSSTYIEVRTSTSGSSGVVFSDNDDGSGTTGYRGTIEYVHSSDQLQFKTAGVTRLTCTSGGDFTATGNVTAYSDISLKENIETIPNALDKVLNLRGVEFDRIDKEDNPHEIGVIAQEVEEVIPEVVLTNTEGIKSVAYGNLVGLLIESIKELKAEINDLKAQVEG